jgi:hypothetical protein
MNQKTSRGLRTIGTVLIASSLLPVAQVVPAALKPPVAITLAPHVGGYKGNDKDKGVYRAAPISPDVIVNFDTTVETPLNPGFSGFNSNLKNAVEYRDANFQGYLKTLSPGWLRFPAGTESEAFNWRTGEIESSWALLLSKPYTRDANTAALPIVAGKGGSSFSDFAMMAKSVGGAKIIVSVNVYTDTDYPDPTQSAYDFARYARKHQIPVVVWELANEPYTWLPHGNFLGQFFADATDYANKMKPYRDAIKAADPNAVVALYFSEAGHPDTTWDNALANYYPKYWDAVTYHEYVHPQNLTSPPTFDELMAAANGNLLSRTTRHVTNYLTRRNNPGMIYLLSEVSPSNGKGGPSVGNTCPVGPDCSPLIGTLYGGIYTAEFALRMSTLPQVKYVASFQVLSSGGIDVTDNHLPDVLSAYDGHTTINTSSGYNFGFFLSAQAAGEAVANGALRNSIGVYETTATGGPTLTTDTGQSIPAVYAQAYNGGNGKRYVVLTNKSNSTMTARIEQNGVVPTYQTNMTFVTGPDGSLTNTKRNPNTIQIHPPEAATPRAVTISPYSVISLDWTEADTTPPVTTAEAPAPNLNGWYTGKTAVTLTAADDLSGVLRTDYSMNDGGGWTTGNSVLVSGSAIHHILYRSIDLAGNVETPKSIIIMLDSKPPVTTVSTYSRAGVGGFEVDLKAVDDLSGVAKTEHSVDGSSIWITGNIFFLCGGPHTVVYRSTDVAGNKEKATSIIIDAPQCAP